jgi:hypothetical protein
MSNTNNYRKMSNTEKELERGDCLYTDREKRIAIAEACGWRRAIGRHPKSNNIVTVWTDGKRGWDHNILPPDYLNDLNAMHEAEKILTADEVTSYWLHINQITLGTIYTISATAAQRAEAFGLTLKLW